MDPNDYQREVLRTLGTHTADDTVTMAALGLAGEVGECVEIVKKAIFHDTPFDPERLKLELGDVLWYLTALCHVSQMTLGDVMEANVAKLRARYPFGFDPERSRNRAEASTNEPTP